MDQADCQRLRKNRLALMDIEPSQILDHLIQGGVFSPDMVDEITSQTTARNQTGKMLNMLEKRGPRAYGKFRQVLQTIPVYKHLVVKLDSTKFTVNVDEVDGVPQRLGGRSSTPANRRGQQRDIQHHSVIGNNNFAIFGGSNTTVNIVHN